MAMTTPSSRTSVVVWLRTALVSLSTHVTRSALLVGLRGDINDNWGWDAYYSKAQLTGNNLLNNDVSAIEFPPGSVGNR